MFSISVRLCPNLSVSCSQDCPSTHDLLNSLRQVEKMLVVHEASYQQGLRSLRKKISALHNSTMVIFKAGKNGEELYSQSLQQEELDYLYLRPSEWAVKTDQAGLK